MARSLNDPVTMLKGVGPKKAVALNKLAFQRSMTFLLITLFVTMTWRLKIYLKLVNKKR